MNINVETILFDLDNTLVKCIIYYNFIRANLIKQFSILSGKPKTEIEDLLSSLESERIKLKDGFSRNAFLDSVNRVRVELGLNCDKSFNLIKFAGKVYDAPYTKYPDIDEALIKLKNMGISMYVVTKGGFYDQSRKVAILPKVFDGLFVVPHKTVGVWEGVVKTIGADPKTTLVIGDSIKDDINAAISAGLNALHINRCYTNWVGDPVLELPSGVESIKSLSELIPDSIFTPRKLVIDSGFEIEVDAVDMVNLAVKLRENSK